MKIDLAVWTAVNGYDWQPGSVYSPKELAGYKDEIGPLVPDSLPLGGMFLKGGRVVFYRVQIAERMDSRGRGAIYCVLGTVPEDRANEVDFTVIFNSAEMAQPQKPFPMAIECQEGARYYKSPLGRSAFDERRFTGVETFSELGGWCAEAKGGRLSVRITGSMDAPLFTVNYKPHAEPVVEPPKPPQQPLKTRIDVYHDATYPPYRHAEKQVSDSCVADRENWSINDAEKSVKPSHDSFLNGFVAGAICGMLVTAVMAWLLWPSKNESSWQNGATEQPPPVSNASDKPISKNTATEDLISQHGQEAQIERLKEPTYKCPKCGGCGFVIIGPSRAKCSCCLGKGLIRE